MCRPLCFHEGDISLSVQFLGLCAPSCSSASARLSCGRSTASTVRCTRCLSWSEAPSGSSHPSSSRQATKTRHGMSPFVADCNQRLPTGHLGRRSCMCLWGGDSWARCHVVLICCMCGVSLCVRVRVCVHVCCDVTELERSRILPCLGRVKVSMKRMLSHGPCSQCTPPFALRVNLRFHVMMRIAQCFRG